MTDFKTAFDRVERRIEDVYDIEVNISDVVDPNTGDFDGLRIKLDYTLDLDLALFVLIHLFGHTVQWNVSEEFRRLGQDPSLRKTDAELAKIYAYERDATRYSLQLMHDAGVADLDRWVSDWFAADWAYLAHLYRTGEKLDPRALFKAGAGERLTPLPIPAFKPQKWLSRWSF
ncbi:MAG: hypothetical protein M5U26_14715 [Planctomycetota bacterium]|nr:hypothetical protein [Planctomycetota bacterium]